MMMTTKSCLRAMAMTLLFSYLVTIQTLVQQAFLEETDHNKGNYPLYRLTPGDKSSRGFGSVAKTDGCRPNNATMYRASTKPHGTVVHEESKAKPKAKAKNVSKPSFPKNFVPKVYQGFNWDNAPIVVAEYKLLFFTQGKVACTEFKKLLRRMMHLDDWQLHQEPNIPHNPLHNGLHYLYFYPLPQAMQMLTDPNWIRAIFVRDPKERFLSAYLDKAVKKGGLYVDRHCCPGDVKKKNSCGKNASKSLLDFLNVIRHNCSCDPHWKPQGSRIDPELWEYVNFVGYFDSLAKDTEQMLRKVGGWEEFGASGWGKYHNESVFAKSSSSKHRTRAQDKLFKYFNSTELEKSVEDFYSVDYERFKFQKLSVEKRE